MFVTRIINNEVYILDLNEEIRYAQSLFKQHKKNDSTVDEFLKLRKQGSNLS